MWLRVVVSLVLPGLSPVRRLRTALMAAPGGVEHRDERRTRSGSTYGLGIMSSIRRITSHNTPDCSDGGIDGESGTARDAAPGAVQLTEPDDGSPAAPPQLAAQPICLEHNGGNHFGNAGNPAPASAPAGSPYDAGDEVPGR